MKGGTKVTIESHKQNLCLMSYSIRFRGVYIAHSSKEDVLCTLNFAPGKTVYGEKKISVDVPVDFQTDG